MKTIRDFGIGLLALLCTTAFSCPNTVGGVEVDTSTEHHGAETGITQKNSSEPEDAIVNPHPWDPDKMRRKPCCSWVVTHYDEHDNYLGDVCGYCKQAGTITYCPTSPN